MYDNEFQYMHSLGLYVSEIRGDGNCLFNALSDQLYGTQDRHHELRHGTVEYIRAHKDTYKHYIEVRPGGATRRQPKRKTAPSSKYQDAFQVTEADVDKAFDAHLVRMAQGGTWGDNMEIVAFAMAFQVNVKIYRTDVTYLIPGTDASGELCHLAYHQWEHYSSIRNIAGPHTGKPQVNPYVLTPEEEAQITARMNEPMPASAIQEWQINSLSVALEHSQPKDTLIKALQETKGNVDDAWNLLFRVSPPPDHASFSSAQSSSIDQDESEEVQANLKRQDRRLSKATKSAQRRRAEKQNMSSTSRLGTYGESLDSLLMLKAHSTPNSSPSRSTTSTLQRHVVYDKNADDTEDEDWQPSSPAPLKDGDTSSSSDYSEQLSTGKVSLKLPKLAPKSASSGLKRLGAARDMKSLKKQAQKQAARERKQAQARAEQAQAASVPMSSQHSSNSTATMTTGLKMVYL